ncbi:hypothetical protein [Gayadomonas joobiniege]|nr:hypothetical protein [Gayadomonas joobiniege]
MNQMLSFEIRELTLEEVKEINGAILANIGMGIVGAAGAMATYCYWWCS